jgi:hypothetical protein
MEKSKVGPVQRRAHDERHALSQERARPATGSTSNEKRFPIRHCDDALVLPMDSAVAQEKQRVSFKVPLENSKFTQRHTLDVGDVPGHQLLLFELHRTHPSNPPVINGVKLVEQIAYAISDNTNGDGTNTGYYTFTMEGGDRVFTRYSLVSQRDQSGKVTSTLVGPITGGTGKFAGGA